MKIKYTSNGHKFYVYFLMHIQILFIHVHILFPLFYTKKII